MEEQLKQYIDNLYSSEAGSHDKPGNRCMCNPLAGLLSEEPWGLYGPNVTEEDIGIREFIIKLLYVAQESGSASAMDYTIRQLAQETSIYNFQKEEEE
tara:strand:+ start:356 stop:649 length:294 start_codon:yes stop_codon:yes gene_type:complete